jgi:glycogen synthase
MLCVPKLVTLCMTWPNADKLLLYLDQAQHLKMSIVLGSYPAGDPVGGAAAQRLWELSAAYPDRMHCPVDHYVSGPEKELLLQATDFCMLPSRFEPCGLVDVEFAWVGDVLPVIRTPWYAGLQFVCY